MNLKLPSKENWHLDPNSPNNQRILLHFCVFSSKVVFVSPKRLGNAVGLPPINGWVKPWCKRTITCTSCFRDNEAQIWFFLQAQWQMYAKNEQLQLKMSKYSCKQTQKLYSVWYFIIYGAEKSKSDSEKWVLQPCPIFIQVMLLYLVEVILEDSLQPLDSPHIWNHPSPVTCNWP